MRDTALAQTLEPSVLYTAPADRAWRFVADNTPQPDCTHYLCSVYTRGFDEFVRFALDVGKDRITVGGYHPTACPDAFAPYASRTVTGYCANSAAILDLPPGVYAGEPGFTPLARDAYPLRENCQVYPDITADDVSGSLVTSVGCPYDCDFCSTPTLSGRQMSIAPLEYVEAEVEDLRRHNADTVFIRDESFATHPRLDDVARIVRAGGFRIVYSFGTAAALAADPRRIRAMADAGWHSLNLGLEDVNTQYRKNHHLAEAVALCRKAGLYIVLSFIVDDRLDLTRARAAYHALYEAFLAYRPAQVCANFLMPFPGTALWTRARDQLRASVRFSDFDSKTPLFCPADRVAWHRRMLVALQWRYYTSDTYREVREFACGDTLYLRMLELARSTGLERVPHDALLELQA